jgi:hypothetical protein
LPDVVRKIRGIATAKRGITRTKLPLNNPLPMIVAPFVLEVVTIPQTTILLTAMMKKATTVMAKTGIILMKRIPIHMEMRNTAINSQSSNKFITNKF